MSTGVTPIKAAQAETRQALAAVIAGDETGLRRLAELLAPYMPGPEPEPEPEPEPDRWLTTKEAAEYAGCSANVLQKAVSARAVHFEQDSPRGRCWFRRADIDAWRRGELSDRRARRAA